MRLIEELRARILAEQSPFRAQLLREDVDRLQKLLDLARATPDLPALRAAGRRLGWTQGDARTAELLPALDPLLEAIRAYASAPSEPGETRVRDAWLALHRLRMERLVGCLSTPVPKPDPD